MKNTLLIDELMGEFVNYGGMAATRKDVYLDLLPITGWKMADWGAFGQRAKTLGPEDMDRLCRFDPITRGPMPQPTV